VFRGAPKVLESALVIITEVEFVPLYVGQPMFGDVDVHLRGQGFLFHTFRGFGQRFFQPFVSPNNPGAGFRQMLWSDAVYVKDFTQFGRLSDEKLLKLAAILDMVIASPDLAGVALAEYDRRHQTAHAPTYVASTIERHQAAKRAQA